MKPELYVPTLEGEIYVERLRELGLVVPAPQCEHGFFKPHWIVKDPDYDSTFTPACLGWCDVLDDRREQK